MMSLVKKFGGRCTLPVINQQNVNRGCRTSSASVQITKPYDSIPGLSKVPIIGSFYHFLPVIGKIGPPENLFKMTQKLYKEFGPIVKMDGVFATRPNMVLLYNPEHYEQVYRAEEAMTLRPGMATLDYYRTELRKSRFDGVYGLLTAQGQQWREFRTKVNPAFLKLKLVKLYEPALDKIAKKMVKRLSKLKDDGTYLQTNFHLEMTKWSLESVALIGLGARLGCLEDDLPDDHPARQLMKCVTEIVNLSLKLEFYPTIWKYIPIPTFKKIIKAFDVQWELSERFIEQARKQIDERGYDIPEEDKSIIEKLLAIDEKVAVMMANEMLLAGIDTVAFTVTGLLYSLATNVKAQDKLRQEIRYGDTNKRYLKACIKESLRLYPILSAFLRQTSKDHIVGGYHIPKGINVVAPLECISKMEKYYPLPLDFIPERWLAEKTDPLYYGNAHPMATMPFGFGVRSCIGRRISELEIEIFVQRLVDEFKISWEGPPIKVVTRLMNAFQIPYNFKFENAK